MNLPVILDDACVREPQRKVASRSLSVVVATYVCAFLSGLLGESVALAAFLADIIRENGWSRGEVSGGVTALFLGMVCRIGSSFPFLAVISGSSGDLHLT